MTSKLEAALSYASWGWRVLPVVPNGKLPATQHGVHDATTNPDQIARWWASNPDFNIGIAAGQESGIVVFDIDPRNGGDESWSEWIKINGRPPDSAMQLTAGGGQHYLAHWDESIRSCKLADGIDLLSTGRYFVAYPSSIEGRTYEWEGSSDPFEGVGPFEVPIRWKIAIDAKKRTQREAKGVANGGLIQGNRNDGLTSLAGAMRRFGMSEAEILAAISIANETRCEIPLPSSEIRQIVHSVARYEPETDVAASMALGSEAAEALLAAEQAGDDYYLTRATSFLTQPAPLQWIIKGWLPSNSTAMLFGESGVGKTFVSLSMACSIATGQQWNNQKTASGTVVYLAGEGNYGIRQRVASWATANNITNLDSLLISNKSIDMDSPGAAVQILKAIRTLTDGTVTLVVIDTLNNHMSGDENSARDTRAMLNACNIVATAVQSSVLLVHHVGHQVDKVRARGSSAWRAALDTSLAVMRSKDDESVIEVSCTKMKDAADPQPIYGRLQKVDLNWCDEDGEVIYGAVFAIEDAPATQPEKKESEFKSEIRKLSNAWWKAGAQEQNGSPYVARNDLIQYLIENEGVSESTAKMYVKEGKKGRLIYNLLTAEIITQHDRGWIICDQVLASALLIRKGGQKGTDGDK